MEHKDYKELIQLYLFDELQPEEMVVVENHLLECGECSSEFESMKQIHDALVSSAPAKPENYLLNQAREELFDKLRLETSSGIEEEGLVQKIKNLFAVNYKFAFSAAALFVFGLVISPVIFNSAPRFNGPGTELASQGSDLSKANVSNIRLVNMPDAEGNIEIEYEEVKPVSFKGNLNDELIQALLAKALLTASNPGVRIRSVNTIAQQAESSFKPDPVVKNALVDALKTDGNPAVRKTALNVLMKYPFDKDIKEAFLHVLTNDENSGLRVLAINALSNFKMEGGSIDQEIINVLNKRAESDENDFVRLRAANLLLGDQ